MIIQEIKEVLNTEVFHMKGFHLSIYQIIFALITAAATKGVLFLAKKIIYRSARFRSGNRGAHAALYQLVKYFVWILSIILILEIFGISITFLLAGSAALLVGVGLGLQQTFNDIISGIILLVEGSVHVEDIIEIENKVYKVESIGLRTSNVVDRNDISCIVPNSKIVNDKVINWSHNNENTRFVISIGLAYGSDHDLVCEVLEESARSHDAVLSDPKPIACFTSFGDSSINFDLYFWSQELFRIELVKSEIRKTITRNLKANHLTIPFPQMDLHLVSSKIDLIK